MLNLKVCVPAYHPLRSNKRRMDAILKKLSPFFDNLYIVLGRPGIPSDQLLKALILMALQTVRSERLFCEQPGDNLPWFLDCQFSQGRFNHSVFARNYERVLSAEVARLFFAEDYGLSRQQGWISDEHFTADGSAH